MQIKMWEIRVQNSETVTSLKIETRNGVLFREVTRAITSYCMCEIPFNPFDQENVNNAYQIKYDATTLRKVKKWLCQFLDEDADEEIADIKAMEFDLKFKSVTIRIWMEEEL